MHCCFIIIWYIDILVEEPATKEESCKESALKTRKRKNMDVPETVPEPSPDAGKRGRPLRTCRLRSKGKF